jgi:hypothetical protein
VSRSSEPEEPERDEEQRQEEEVAAGDHKDKDSHRETDRQRAHV